MKYFFPHILLFVFLMAGAVQAQTPFTQIDEERAKNLGLKTYSVRVAETSERFASKDIAVSIAALGAMKRIPAAAWPPEYANKILNKVTVSATPDLKFTPTEFSVKAGSAVELMFRNPDSMYHNLVIVKAGALEQVGLKADLMAARPDGLDKNYVPDDPNVLHWTPQITLGIARSYVLKFFAPEEPGDYPYICTFPGHWRVMRGVMKVTK